MVEATDDGIMIGIATRCTLCLLIYYYCYGNIHKWIYIYIYMVPVGGRLPPLPRWYGPPGRAQHLAFCNVASSVCASMREDL